MIQETLYVYYVCIYGTALVEHCEYACELTQLLCVTLNSRVTCEYLLCSDFMFAFNIQCTYSKIAHL